MEVGKALLSKQELFLLDLFFFLEVTMLSEWESKSGRWWRQVLVLGSVCWWENRDRNGQEQWQWALVNCRSHQWVSIPGSQCQWMGTWT